LVSRSNPVVRREARIRFSPDDDPSEKQMEVREMKKEKAKCRWCFKVLRTKEEKKVQYCKRCERAHG